MALEFRSMQFMRLRGVPYHRIVDSGRRMMPMSRRVTLAATEWQYFGID
jgi:hypothetical protein